MNKKIHAVYIGYLILYFLTFAIPSLASPVREFGMLAIAVFPAFFIIQRKLIENRFWKAMAAACLVWGIGQLVWIAGRHNLFNAPPIQDSAYWMFKLLVLGAVLYRPFYAATDVHRRLHLVDISLALSIIFFYVSYFFIVPNLVGGQVESVFYGTAASAFLNLGVALTTAIVALKAGFSGWRRSYWLIALGMSSYTMASLIFVLSQADQADPLWCVTFWAIALSAASAPARHFKPIDEVLIPSRYGFGLVLITVVCAVHFVTSLFSGASHELYDWRTVLTLVEVLILTGLLHFRQKIVIEESDLRQNRLEVTLNAMRQPLYIVDSDYNVILANDVFRTSYGTAGGLCHSIIFGRSTPCEWCHMAKGIAFSTTVENRGAVYQLEFAPLTSGGVELLLDVTNERKRQQQAVQTERMAALGRMIAGTAHELNNPLAIILGNTHLLRDHTLPAEGSRKLSAISAAAERARDIVQTFLTLSRPEGDKALLDLVPIIRSVEHLKSNELRLYNIELDLDLPESMTMLGKYTMLQEIFLNLIDNAQDAIREAKRMKGLIVIHGEILPNERIRVQVSDNGGGIRREHLTQVFDPFFSTKDVGKGTGLGLSVVHSIVTDHKGKIDVQSDGQTFTRFDLQFPQVRFVPPLSKEPQREPTILRILAVDDEPAILTILETALGRRGHHVECTTTGSRALQLLAKNKFDVLLLDVHLPEMDGRTIYSKVQAMGPAVSVRTILITGDTMSEDVRTFADEHGLPMIMKPIDLTRLSDVLETSVLPRL